MAWKSRLQKLFKDKDDVAFDDVGELAYAEQQVRADLEDVVPASAAPPTTSSASALERGSTATAGASPSPSSTSPISVSRSPRRSKRRDTMPASTSSLAGSIQGAISGKSPSTSPVGSPGAGKPLDAKPPPTAGWQPSTPSHHHGSDSASSSGSNPSLGGSSNTGSISASSPWVGTMAIPGLDLTQPDQEYMDIIGDSPMARERMRVLELVRVALVLLLLLLRGHSSCRTFCCNRQLVLESNTC